ncbi:hypothetical protein [Capnocytophaga canimorsus]|uniref:hypothetical protein n=1 Tax=Capnocytophaga canimorsus TaxID=28188 RepID=UPI001AC660E0|nr:hypothetical protein [Capnocytophaga canimorsus]GIM58262.1 hypothetical protein CAPN007_04690 [Capnocytophaga canimorsus]
MKNVLKIVGVFCLAFVAFACSKNDDPADNDLFVGKYKGSVSFSGGDKKINTDNGSVTVAKIGENYNFVFSDGIEDLTGVKFKKEGDNTLVNVDFQDGIQYIKITKNSLNMLYMKDGKTWKANAKR